MDLLMIILRIIHIASGVFWVGAAVAFFAFVRPSARAIGPDAGRFMAELNVRRRFPIVVLASGAVTVLAGLWLYWIDSGGFDLDWIGTGFGATLTVGAVSALIALGIGGGYVRPRADRVGAIGARLGSEGRPPTAEEAQELATLNAALDRAGVAVLILLGVAVIAMAIARYVG